MAGECSYYATITRDGVNGENAGAVFCHALHPCRLAGECSYYATTPYIHVGWHSNASARDDDAGTSGGRYLGRGDGPNGWHIALLATPRWSNPLTRFIVEPGFGCWTRNFIHQRKLCSLSNCRSSPDRGSVNANDLASSCSGLL